MFAPRSLRLICGITFLFVCMLTFSYENPQASTTSPAPAQAGARSPGSMSSSLTDALELYRKGDFDGAIQKYQQALQLNPKSAEAFAGLTRVFLKSKDVQQASETITKALQINDVPELHVALGEVYFRQGKISAAEHEWVQVLNSGHADARAYLGLARVRWAVSMYKSAGAMLDKAHSLDPSDPEIRNYWSDKLSRAERIKYLEGVLAGENNEDEDTRTAMRHYLEYLKARAKDPRGVCRLVSKSATTETKLVRLLIDPQHLRGYGLTLDVNGHKSNLMLDTGASGILINKNLAEKAGVTRLSDVAIGGIGDKGHKNGYRGLASSLKIGGLEFQNCPVEVIEKRSIVDEDGLIGADVFSSFLVEIDFPNEKLRLNELPKRPEDSEATLKLKTEEDDSEPETESAEQKSTSTSEKEKKTASSGLRDRYIAPEMKLYTPVFRFGHFLLVPTAIDKVPGKLFMIDTGAFTNHITPAAAREVTKVHGDSDTIVKGISGSVKNVFRADEAVLQFGHLRQENQDLVAFDLTRISDDLGTEISGTLGFTTLRFIDMKIDYRDGLVDFSYDPKRWGQ